MNSGLHANRRRLSPYIACCEVLFLLLPGTLCVAQASDHPIVFKAHQTKAYTSGQFSKTVHEVCFLFIARAGQHLLVRIRPLSPELITAAVVIYPSGKQDGGPGGTVFDSELSETGKYRLRVSQRQSEVEGRFRVLVELSPLAHDRTTDQQR